MIPTETAATASLRGKVREGVLLAGFDGRTLRPTQCLVQRNIGAGDGGGAGSSVSLNNITVDGDAALSKRAKVS